MITHRGEPPSNNPERLATPRHTIIRICGRPRHDDRPPLPAGHPTAWSLLTDGTSLHGSSYPYPVFDL